jgi:hypothetical protein
MPLEHMNITNIGIIPNPVNGTRIIIGNIENTDDIYIRREALELDKASKNSAHTRGGGAHMGKMVWIEKCYRIFSNSFRQALRMKREKEWDETYIQFIKMCLSSSVNNYDQFIKFVTGFKIFETDLPKGVKLFLNKESEWPHEIVDVTPTHYIMRDYYDASETVEVSKAHLERLAYENWQVTFRDMSSEYF